MARGVSADKLTGSEKAAVLLLNLGGELASKVLQTMDEEEIQNLGNYMASIGTVTPAVSKKVNEEFLFKTAGGASMGFSTGNVATCPKLNPIARKCFASAKPNYAAANPSAQPTR